MRVKTGISSSFGKADRGFDCEVRQCVSGMVHGDGGTAVRVTSEGVLEEERGGLGRGYREEAPGDLLLSMAI